MRPGSLDRACEAALLLLAVAIIWQGAALVAPISGTGSGSPVVPLAALRPSPPPPSSEVDRARVLVDGNAPRAREETAALVRSFPGSAEAWSLAARFHEGAGEERLALEAWARAVRLDPALADKKSTTFLGGRIGALVDRALTRLRTAKRTRALFPEEKVEIENAYYLRRRLAGGCE